MFDQDDDILRRPQRPSPKLYSAPRRFDLATIFTVTLAYAILFALMSLLAAPPVVSISIAGFVAMVAVAQAVLFDGAHPRAASLACGSSIFLLIGLALTFWLGTSAVFNYTIPVMLTFGGVMGYLTGVLVGGVFLVSDIVRTRIKRWRGNG
ncbi:MAG: hypothetical protein KDA63_10680 [Planctomycetales bacterium]|nr:hypothetical protein [Planctomycetales bacterium]